jgi:hypothetical protein
MGKKWEEWMLTGGGIVNGFAKEPSRQLVAEWVVDVYTKLPAQIVRKAWMKTGYKWF